MGWVKCLSVYAGAGRGDRGDGRSAVSGSSARGGYGNMEQLSAARTNQGSSVNNVIISSVFYDHYSVEHFNLVHNHRNINILLINFPSASV